MCHWQFCPVESVNTAHVHMKNGRTLQIKVDDVIPLAQLFQEIPTDDPAVGGGLTNVESKVKELLGQGVWDDDSGENTLPSVRLVVNKDELEGSNDLTEKQVCHVKSVRGENLSDKGMSCPHSVQKN